MSNHSKSKEYKELVLISKTLEAEYKDEDTRWNNSPFAWIKHRPSRSIGAIGEKIVAAWLSMHDFNVCRAPDTEADRMVEDKRVEIKFSTLWKDGTYLFEQIRDQNYDFAIFLGVSPHDAHCWVVPKSEIMVMWKNGSLQSQHGGRGGHDTKWARLSPAGNETADDKLFAPFGNGLHAALDAIGEQTGFQIPSLADSFDQ